MIAHILYVGGVDLELRLPFIAAMRDHGFQVTVAGSGDAEPFRRAGIDFVPFHFDRFITPFSDWRAVRDLAAILRDLKPDLAQSFDTKPLLMLPLAARLAAGHTLVVRTVCGLGWIHSSRSIVASIARPVYRLLHRIGSSNTAATVFQTDCDRKYLESYQLVGRNDVLIPAGGGGVDVDGFERALAAGPSRDEMRADLGLGTAEVVITVTRMTKQKGIGALMEAAAIVHKQRPGVKFLLVGPRESEGPYAISQDEIDAHAPYVVATGPRSDVPALLRMADVFAFPTEFAEGVPRVLLEAGIANLPVVSTTMPGCCEVIRDGWNGLLAPTKAPEILAEKIQQMLGDRNAAQVMAENASKRVRENYSIEVMSARMRRLYVSLLEDRRKPSREFDAIASEAL
jgi:glycosyltransferase involved in cell wall biosynthesis